MLNAQKKPFSSINWSGLAIVLTAFFSGEEIRATKQEAKIFHDSEIIITKFFNLTL